MKVDLHVHSEFSRRPSTWLLKKVGCAESYTDPLSLYNIAKQKGMAAVTITDHNCIDGCREISHLPDTFVGCEATSYFPEDGTKVHILVYRISEHQFDRIEELRENIYDLTKYLREQKIFHAMSHPFYKVNDSFDIEHFEKCLLLLGCFEINGDIDPETNAILKATLAALTPEAIEAMANEYNIEPYGPDAHIKRYVGGSDDHSSLTIAYTNTQVPGAKNIDQLFEGLWAGNVKINVPHPGVPLTFAHNIYGVAYQYYNKNFNIGKHHERSVLIRFLDRMLQSRPVAHKKIWNRMYYHWRRRRHRKMNASQKSSITQLLQHEAQKLIESDKGLRSVLHLGHQMSKKPDQHWYRFVNSISNRMLAHLGSHIASQISGGNPFDIFHTLGSAGALYTLLAPYFVSYTMYMSCRRFAEEAARKAGVSHDALDAERLKVAHFTDTFHEINGVARMLQEELAMAQLMGKELMMVTCPSDDEKAAPVAGLRYFDPVAVHSLPEYPEVKVTVPPLLDMLKFCYEQNFSHIHAATPGLLGLSAIVISKVLKLPLYTTYHTSIPQYARYLTGDSGVEDLAWRYILWFYDQSDVIFCPSHSTGNELISKGIAEAKIRIIPRGVDTKLFKPENKCDTLSLPAGTKLLYLGRVSKEKDLPLLANAFKQLTGKHPDVHLVVVGDGPYLEEMKQELKGYPCVFTGYLTGEELTGVFTECDLFVFPSTTDTFGNVVLEAQASGLPIVVSDKGGPCENLVPGQTGLIVEGNNEKAFLDAMLWMLEDRDRLAQMGKNAYDYASGRDYHKAFEEYWQLYHATEEMDKEPETAAEKNGAGGFGLIGPDLESVFTEKM